MAPDPADVAANKELLREPHIGIFKVYPDADCESAHQIKVDGECAGHVPGGSTYSFRWRAIGKDIKFNHGRLVGDGFFAQTIITELGDITLSGLDLQSHGVQPL
ncbi:MAG TPA: hypothetical protein VGI80_08100, partial [Pyrinomonadaceae bacterium]